MEQKTEEINFIQNGENSDYKVAEKNKWIPVMINGSDNFIQPRWKQKSSSSDFFLQYIYIYTVKQTDSENFKMIKEDIALLYQ